MSSSQPTKERTTAAVEDLIDSVRANKSIPNTDTSTAVRGSAVDTLATGGPVGEIAMKSNSAAIARHNDQDAEPPRIDNDHKPDITKEMAPIVTETIGVAPTFDTDNFPADDEQPQEGKPNRA
ncbi:hypothetical protein LTR84_003288 [Exophiala bonariae]|uniref:SMP domain-containing protein n=1 Tax=Exophiala bonariae TaxID=1690606 RepID=A0AAV9N8K5_9EURO|nr:hypothetical protein LTR84_003288 [Exophiala bonariae]